MKDAAIMRGQSVRNAINADNKSLKNKENTLTRGDETYF